jgi:hypothetical protein
VTQPPRGLTQRERPEVSPARAVAVTAGLVVVGGLVGAVCGAIALLTLTWWLSGEVYLVNIALGALFGFPTGAVLAPVLGWGLLRQVPLGRAIGHCAIGTTLGGLLGGLAVFSEIGPWYLPVVLAGVGFLFAAIRLRLQVNRLP